MSLTVIASLASLALEYGPAAIQWDLIHVWR